MGRPVSVVVRERETAAPRRPGEVAGTRTRGRTAGAETAWQEDGTHPPMVAVRRSRSRFAASPGAWPRRAHERRGAGVRQAKESAARESTPRRRRANRSSHDVKRRRSRMMANLVDAESAQPAQAGATEARELTRACPVRTTGANLDRGELVAPVRQPCSGFLTAAHVDLTSRTFHMQ